ncbi:type I-E CRISPR-associated endonuclease Cas1e [Yaniella flava]|uniref:CRISPR-associated endonuclease Cas1 n=1 Tax=Yaniella flava TaxID=287930 RepID=A0ABN2UYJ0_9MICC
MSISAHRPEASELTRTSDRLSFVYVERCTVHRDDNALTATTKDGVLHIPSATIGCLLLGPGTSITYAAMALLGDFGVSVVWVGENGVRYYAHGRSLARSSRLLISQAQLVSNTRSRLDVARKMYAMRFPGEDVAKLTMQQLRGREGARVRRLYREASKSSGVEWSKRDYDPDDFDSSDDINKALTAANASLYGVVQSVITALGCSPGLGFVHTGNDRSFVYDIADLYKADITIPAAFEVAATGSMTIGSDVRRLVRDKIVEHRLLERCARDVTMLLAAQEDEPVEEWIQDDIVSLWSGPSGEDVPSGTGYGDDY